ncbi:hypothetical protein MAR_017075, partial [Mya arenaria]
DGMLKAKSDDHDTIELIEGAAVGMVATLSKWLEGTRHKRQVRETSRFPVVRGRGSIPLVTPPPPSQKNNIEDTMV